MKSEEEEPETNVEAVRESGSSSPAAVFKPLLSVSCATPSERERGVPLGNGEEDKEGDCEGEKVERREEGWRVNEDEAALLTAGGEAAGSKREVARGDEMGETEAERGESAGEEKGELSERDGEAVPEAVGATAVAERGVEEEGEEEAASLSVD